ncbi:hypothetical protein GCM10009839_09600 [Catenulispora yoronensis]|uniref:Uncharacterized protein n=1 Tax=Catenulispora yoronensis TaxID=450799 RepID=A0ABP5F4E1_9ACTN
MLDPATLADGYGMSAEERAELLDVIKEVTDVERAEIAARLEGGDAASVKAFQAHGGWAPWDRLQTWLADQRATFLAALVR